MNKSKVIDALDEFCTFVSDHPPPNITFKKVVIPEDGYFEVLAHGWKGGRRIHTPLIHIEFNSEKILVVNNGTDIDLTEWLVERGIPRDAIKPGHLPPDLMEIVEKD